MKHQLYNLAHEKFWIVTPMACSNYSVYRNFHYLVVSLIIATLINILFLSSVAECKNYNAEVSNLYNEAIRAYRTRHFNLAKQTFYKIIEEYPDDYMADPARYNLANLLRDLKEYDKAIEIYKQIIEKSNPNDASNAKIELVSLLYSIHRYREGIELLEGWLKSDKVTYDRDELACKLAQFYLQSGNKDEAWLLLEKHMERGNKKAFDELLDLAIKSGEVEKLLSTLDNHRAKLRVSVYSSYVADCYLALGRKDKAIEAIKENKDYVKDTSIMKKLADIQISANKIDDAIDTLEKTVAFLPYDWQSLRKLGHCYFLKNDKTKAIEVWKKNLNRRFSNNQENYLNYTSVLIEHQLLKEALEAFDDARKSLGSQTLFAEERAAVLEALGRDDEAMEENLNVLADGIFNQEVFDKLYNAKIDNFDLEKRLTELNKTGFSQAINQALIEFYFRKARLEDINKMSKLIDARSTIFFDDLFYDRLKQEALLVPEEFHFSLIKKMIEARKDSALELKLASLILKMPEYNEKWIKDAYNYAKNTANSEVIADSDLKYELYFNLADFAFNVLKSPKEADSYLAMILKRNLFQPTKNCLLNAKLMRAKLQTYMSNLSDAESILNEVATILDGIDMSGDLNQLEKEEFLMQQKVEMARLKAHLGKYQEALYVIKDVIEGHKEGEYVNDALELALEITRYSLGDFSAINHILSSERYAASGNNIEAVKELDESIKALPASSTKLIADLEANKIMLSFNEKNFNEIIENIKKYNENYPDSLKKPDLAEYKIRIMQKVNKSQDLIDEEMRSFISNYPNDLRSGKYKLCLENGAKK